MGLDSGHDLDDHISQAMDSLIEMMVANAINRDLEDVLPIIVSTKWEVDESDKGAVIHVMPVPLTAIMFAESASQNGAGTLGNMVGFMGKTMALSNGSGMEFVAIAIAIKDTSSLVSDDYTESGTAIVAMGCSRDGEYESIRIQPITVDGTTATETRGEAVSQDVRGERRIHISEAGEQQSLFDILNPFFLANANDDPSDFSWSSSGDDFFLEAAASTMRKLMERNEHERPSKKKKVMGSGGFPLKGRYAMVSRVSESY